MANLGLSSPILWPTPRRLLAPARRFYLSDTETAQSASLPGMALRTDPIPSRSSRDTTPGYVIGDALQHEGKKATVVWARATATTVNAYIDDVRVTDHDRLGPGRRSTKGGTLLPEHRRDFRHRDATYWRERAGQLGADVLGFVGSVLDHDPQRSRVHSGGSA